MFGLCIDGETDPYVISDDRDQLDSLIWANRRRGHDVTVVIRDMVCTICTDRIDRWVFPDDDPVHDGACLSEYLAWRQADVGFH